MSGIDRNEVLLNTFVIDYIGDRSVSFMMILDSVMYRYYGKMLMNDVPLRSTVTERIQDILRDYMESGVVVKDRYNFYTRVIS